MKNQYACDIGDYGKLGLLRQLSDAGFQIGLNWYLTPDEAAQNNDGKFISYLKTRSFRSCDPQLWETLGVLVDEGKRKVQSLQSSEILSASFYDACMDFSGQDYLSRKDERRQWHQQALAGFHGCDIVFVDPDNGLMVPSAERGKKSNKYVLPEELHDYYASGASVIYYQHKARCKDSVYIDRNANLIASGNFLNAKGFGLKFFTTSQRYYFFLVHPRHEERIKAAIDTMLKTEWSNHFALLE